MGWTRSRPKPRWTPNQSPVGNNDDWPGAGFETHIRSISDTWLKMPVGQDYSYSNMGIDLAAYIIQVASGKPFPEYAQEKVCTPLGMTHSTYDVARIMEDPDRAIGHEAGFDRLPHVKQAVGGQVFPQVQIKDFPRLERFDVDFDLPECILPEFPPPIFLTTHPELGDVSQGEVLHAENFDRLFRGLVTPAQLDGLRMLVTRPRSVSCHPPLIAIESTRPATQKRRTSRVHGTARKRRARRCR